MGCIDCPVSTARRSHVCPKLAEDAAVLQVFRKGLLEVVDCPIPPFQMFFTAGLLVMPTNAACGGRELAAINSQTLVYPNKIRVRVTAATVV